MTAFPASISWETIMVVGCSGRLVGAKEIVLGQVLAPALLHRGDESAHPASSKRMLGVGLG